jgi:hypothetical protein
MSRYVTFQVYDFNDASFVAVWLLVMCFGLCSEIFFSDMKALKSWVLASWWKLLRIISRQQRERERERAVVRLLSESRPAGFVFISKLQENRCWGRKFRLAWDINYIYKEIGVVRICMYKVRHTDLSFELLFVCNQFHCTKRLNFITSETCDKCACWESHFTNTDRKTQVGFPLFCGA